MEVGTRRIRIGFFAIFGVAIAYAGAAALSELRLIELLRSPSPTALKPVTYNEQSFYNKVEMLIFQADERRDKFYPWSHVLEEWQAVLLVACSAGFWGGFMRFLFEGKPKRAGSVDTPLMGLAIGPALTVVSGMYSAMMMEGSLHFRPTAVAVLCFLAGIAWEQSWAFIEKMAKSKYGQK